MGDRAGYPAVPGVAGDGDGVAAGRALAGESMPAGAMGAGTAARFALTARRLGEEARRLGLKVPAFRSPPRMLGADRTIRRRSDHVTVAVRSRDRPWPAVLADLIEGVIVANDLSPPESGRLRADLWAALADFDAVAA